MSLTKVPPVPKQFEQPQQKVLVSPEKLYEMYQGGASMLELGEMFGCSRERVRQLIVKHERARGLPKERHLKKAAIMAAYSPTKTKQEIAAEVGATREYVSLVLGDKKTKHGLARPDEDQILEDYRNGMPLKELCSKYGFSRPQIFNTWRANKVPARSKR